MWSFDLFLKALLSLSSVKFRSQFNALLNHFVMNKSNRFLLFWCVQKLFFGARQSTSFSLRRHQLLKRHRKCHAIKARVYFWREVICAHLRRRKWLQTSGKRLYLQRARLLRDVTQCTALTVSWNDLEIYWFASLIRNLLLSRLPCVQKDCRAFNLVCVLSLRFGDDKDKRRRGLARTSRAFTGGCNKFGYSWLKTIEIQKQKINIHFVFRELTAHKRKLC